MKLEQAVWLPARQGVPWKRQGAFSLMEMAVVLAILGLLLIGVGKIFPALRGETLQGQEPEQLALADEAILGFALKNHRLPCPAPSGGNGRERVAADGGCAATVGEFPFHTLGLRLPARLRYGVWQDANASLTRASARHTPELPPLSSSATEWPLPLGESGRMSTLDHVTLVRDTTGFAGAAAWVNGLDFCAALRDVLPAPGIFLQSGEVTVAYALAHPGARDADADDDLFDGDNRTVRTFAPPGEPLTDRYDDHVLAVGFAELAGRLACPTYLSRANAAAHTAYAAYDNFILALAMLQYQAFELDVASYNLQQAYTGVANASLSVLSSTMSIIDAVVAYATSSATLASVLAVASGLNATVSETVAIIKLVDAIKKINPSNDENSMNKLASSKTKRVDAEAKADMLRVLADQTARRALALDAKGLTP